MATQETRSIWLVLKDGVPQGTAWAHVETYAEGVEHYPSRPSSAAALGVNQLAADGWSATPTQWRRAPELIGGNSAQFLPTAPSLDGRDLVIGGCRVSLDKRGASRGPSREPSAPELIADTPGARGRAIAEIRKGVKRGSQS